jgi:hypothetical protein
VVWYGEVLLSKRQPEQNGIVKFGVNARIAGRPSTAPPLDATLLASNALWTHYAMTSSNNALALDQQIFDGLRVCACPYGNVQLARNE